MFLLPRGKIIKEQLDSAKMKMPDALLKMCTSHFSGYLAFDNENSNAILCYANGKILAALWQDEDERLCGGLALEMIFRVLQSAKCLMGVYRLEEDFIPYLQQFCCAQIDCANQVVDLLDISRLTKQVQQENFSGCLRLHTNKRVVLIFYLSGKAQGFFCDGATGLTDNVDISTSIVKDDDCLLDVLAVDSGACTKCKLVGVNIEKVWLQIWRELNL
jgi:hypothetical protein